MILAFLQVVLTRAQNDAIAEAIVGLAVAGSAVMPFVTAYLIARLNRATHKISRVQDENVARLEKATQRAPKRDTDNRTFEADNVPGVSAVDIDGPKAQPTKIQGTEWQDSRLPGADLNNLGTNFEGETHTTGDVQ